MNARLLIMLFLMPVSAMAQGFAGMGSDAEGFAHPRAGYTFDFPADHGAHPDFRIEWWYLTANLTAPDGTPHGVQWTLFRSALAPGAGSGWESPQVWFGHAAVTTPGAHHVAERFARGGIGQAGVRAAPFSAWIDEWEMAGDMLGTMRLSAAGADFAYALDLRAQGPLVFHGQDGFSVKSAKGQASHYYSQPFFTVEGILSLPDGDVAVTGTAWLDREWSSQPLAADQSGWDWFALSFESGEKLMGFRLRQADGDHYASGSWIAPDGRTTPLKNAEFDAQPLESTRVADRAIPTRWRVVVPGRALDITVEALNPAAWMETSVPYWEGPVAVSGSHRGRGYLEMTGYE